ncbi:MAG: sensor domain-containing diguanylate cyclase [Fibrobacterota bacterium]
MGRNAVIALRTAEILAYTVLFILLVSGLIAPPKVSAPLPAYLIAGTSVLIFATNVLLCSLFPRAGDSLRTVMISFLGILLGASTVTYSWSPVDPFIGTAILLTIFTASRGTAHTWVVSLVMGVSLLRNFSSGHILNGDHAGLYVIALACTAYLSSFLRQRFQKNSYEFSKKEEVLKSRKTLSDETEELIQKEKDEDEVSQSPELNIQNNTDLKELMAKEMDYVVYFVERIFHPHSTIAFIYDTQTSDNRKVLTLYSAKSRSMNINYECRITEGDGIIGEVAKTGETFISGNLTLYNKDIGYYRGNEAISFLVAVPIISRTGRLLGVLAVDFMEKKVFREHHKDAIHRFAKIAASLLTNIHLRRKEQENAARFQLFYDTSRSISNTNNNIEILKHLLSAIRKTGDIFRASAVAYFPDSSTCRIIAVNSDNREIAAGFTFSAGVSIVTSTFLKGAIEYVSDYSKIRENTPIYASGEDLNRQIHSVLTIPFKGTGANYEIAIVAESTQRGLFSTKSYRDNINTLVKNGSTAYEKAILYQKMQLQATTDGLTGLVNHRTFQEHLHDHILRSHRYNRNLSLLLMDIDHFKDFNDTYGHQVGDLVLKAISRCLQKSVRSSDLVARYGGEEFVVILPETDVKNAHMMAERIRINIEKEIIETENKKLHVTVSIGLATLNIHAAAQSKLIEAADGAMYHSKKGGRNRVTVYSEGMSPE